MGIRFAESIWVRAQGSGTLHPHVQRFRGGLVFKANGLLYLSTLGLRVIKKKRRKNGVSICTHPHTPPPKRRTAFPLRN